MERSIGLISEREKRAIFLVSLLASLFVGFLFVEEAAYKARIAEQRRENLSKGISLSGDDFGHKSPGGLLLLIPLITVALIRPKRFWISTGLTVVLGVLFTIGSYLRLESAMKLEMLRPFWNAFDFGDYLFGMFLLVMIGWQVSILRRLATAKP